MAYTNLTDLFKGICDAIRAKKGTTGIINHQDIPSEIASITTGGTGITPTGTIDITSNGTHNVTSYAQAKVNVPIPSGYVYPSGNKNITANGTNIDVKNYATASVNVPIPSGYIKPSGNMPITSNGTNIDVASYSTVSVNVPVPSGYVYPSISYHSGETIIDPGSYYDFPEGSYLPFGYRVSAQEGSHGYAGDYDYQECIDRSDIEFIFDDWNADSLMGWMVICENGIGSAPSSSSRENILSILYRKSMGYVVQSIDVESGIWTVLEDNSLGHYFVDNTIHIHCGTDSVYRFIENKTYYFFPFYSQDAGYIIA